MQAEETEVRNAYMAKIGFLLLSGGKSSRMGTPKALLEIEGKTLLETVAEAGKRFEERILSVNDPFIPTPDGFVRCVDVYPNCGPMAGIHAALTMTDCDALVTAPCDAPYYSSELAQYLLGQFEPELDALVLMDRDGRAQPLTGVYSKSCLPVLEEHLKTNRLKIMWMLEEMKLKRISLPDHIAQKVFRNLNTKEEYEHFQERDKGNAPV